MAGGFRLIWTLQSVLDAAECSRRFCIVRRLPCDFKASALSGLFKVDCFFGRLTSKVYCAQLVTMEAIIVVLGSYSQSELELRWRSSSRVSEPYWGFGFFAFDGGAFVGRTSAVALVGAGVGGFAGGASAGGPEVFWGGSAVRELAAGRFRKGFFLCVGSTASSRGSLLVGDGRR